MEVEGTRERRLDRGHATRAIALDGMAVADRESRAIVVDGKIERRARDEVLVVEVAAVHARLDRRDGAPPPRRRDAHHAEEWAQRNLEAPRKRARLRVAIEAREDLLEFIDVGWQRARERPHVRVAPVLPQGDVEDAHLQHIPGPRAMDTERPREDV